MPLYDFRCRSCGHEFEALVRGADAPSCVACQGGDLERLLSTFGVSTAEKSQAAAKSSRQRQIHRDRDRRIAEQEAREHHDD